MSEGRTQRVDEADDDFINFGNGKVRVDGYIVELRGATEEED